MKELEKLNYDEILALTEEEVASVSIESMDIKGYNVYFVDFKEFRGYSCLVFKNKHLITDDYASCHSYILKEKGVEGLREYYIESIGRKLFTEDEIDKRLESYDDYQLKSYFLNNYYAKQEDYISMFFIGSDEEWAEREKEISGMLYNRAGFCYMDKKLEAFVDRHCELLDKLELQKDNVSENYDYQRNAFLYEMYNHEYAINWQGDWDVLSVFGKVTYQRSGNALNKYFDELHFNDIQRKAYLDARRECLAKSVA